MFVRGTLKESGNLEQELPMRSFRDRDYLITPECFIFVVIGNLHPADRVIAYLKYVPDKHGRWGHGDSHYRRVLEHYSVPCVIDSMRFLRENAPEYVFESNVHGISLPAVPTWRIAEHLRPEQRVLQLQSAGQRDELENKALRLIERISLDAGVSVDSLGLTGSVLAGIHDPSFSDIDIVVYGSKNAFRVKSYLQNKPSTSSIRELAGTSREKWIAERLSSTSLTRQNVLDLLARKWNIGLFEGTEFSVHAVHTESEAQDRYGDERYVPVGIVDATAKIGDCSESLFMPAVYRVDTAALKGAFSGYTVDRIVSFEGLYADVARDGEGASCRGKLERVESVSGLRHRIVIGSPEAEGNDYLLPIQS
jgi:predicted nucleotidyltransferase